MEIVRASGDDWETVRDVRLAALSEAPYAFGSTYEREVNQTETDWRAWIEDADSALFIARANGEPVGMVGVYSEDAETAHLIAMWVAPQARNLGVGMALVDAVRDWAHERGYTSAVLDVADDNEPAVLLYRKLGFEATGESRPLPFAPDRRTSKYVFRL